MAATVVDALEFDEKTGKRATHEALALTPRNGAVDVRNESHGDPDEHTYEVELVAGLPARCTCPHWEFRREACKHMVRVAMSPAVIDAATPTED